MDLIHQFILIHINDGIMSLGQARQGYIRRAEVPYGLLAYDMVRQGMDLCSCVVVDLVSLGTVRSVAVRHGLVRYKYV
jgi:hypothetical protein